MGTVETKTADPASTAVADEVLAHMKAVETFKHMRTRVVNEWKAKKCVIGSSVVLAYEDSRTDGMSGYKIKFAMDNKDLERLAPQWFSSEDMLTMFKTDRDGFAVRGLAMIIFSFRDRHPDHSEETDRELSSMAFEVDGS